VSVGTLGGCCLTGRSTRTPKVVRSLRSHLSSVAGHLHVMPHDMPLRRRVAVACVLAGVVPSAWSHGQDAIVPGLAIVVETLIALVVAAAILVRGAQAGRLARALFSALKFLGLFVVSTVAVAGIFGAILHPEGLYSMSVPAGFTAGLLIALLWYFKRGQNWEREHAP